MKHVHTMIFRAGAHAHFLAFLVFALFPVFALCSCGSLQPLTRSHVTTTRYDADGRVTETVVEEKSEALAKSWIEATKGCDVVIAESGWGVKLAVEPQATSGMLPGMGVKAGKIDTVYQRHATEAAAQNEAANIAANKGEFSVGATGVNAGPAGAKGSSEDGSGREDATLAVVKEQLSAAAKSLAAKAKTAEDGEEAADPDVEYPEDDGLHGPDVDGEDYHCESCESATVEGE